MDESDVLNLKARLKDAEDILKQYLNDDNWEPVKIGVGVLDAWNIDRGTMRGRDLAKIYFELWKDKVL